VCGRAPAFALLPAQPPSPPPQSPPSQYITPPRPQLEAASAPEHKSIRRKAGRRSRFPSNPAITHGNGRRERIVRKKNVQPAVLGPHPAPPASHPIYPLTLCGRRPSNTGVNTHTQAPYLNPEHSLPHRTQGIDQIRQAGSQTGRHAALGCCPPSFLPFPSMTSPPPPPPPHPHPTTTTATTRIIRGTHRYVCVSGATVRTQQWPPVQAQNLPSSLSHQTAAPGTRCSQRDAWLAPPPPRPPFPKPWPKGSVDT